MFFISHRGNINGINTKYENHPNFIMSALKMGYHVEVDVRIKNNKFFLGHDEPIYDVNSKFLANRKIWCHAKSSDALFALKKITLSSMHSSRMVIAFSFSTISLNLLFLGIIFVILKGKPDLSLLCSTFSRSKLLTISFI